MLNRGMRNSKTRKPISKPKLKACRICKERFEPRSPMAVACSPQCAIKHAASQRHKAEQQLAKLDRADTARRKDALKKTSDWAKEAEKAVNLYVRIRDRHLPCCSCDKGPNWDGQWHASHFKSVGSNSALRFNLYNIHKGCSQCNRNKSGNINEYRPRLVDKIGQERVEWLDNHPRSRTYTVEYLQRIKKIFNKKAKRLAKRMELDNNNLVGRND